MDNNNFIGEKNNHLPHLTLYLMSGYINSCLCYICRLSHRGQE